MPTFYINGEHFPCCHTVIETQVEVWENEILKWKHEPIGRASVPITYIGTREEMFSKITRVLKTKTWKWSSVIKA